MVKAIVPVISPIDIKEVRNVLRYVRAAGTGADVVFINGTNGCAYAMDRKQRMDYLTIGTTEARSLGMPVYAGITGEDLDETLTLARMANTFGVEAAVLMPIAITKRDGEFSRRIGDNVRRVLSELEVPLILYNLPQRTGDKNINTSVWGKFAEDSRVVALKDSSGDRRRLEHYRQAARDNAEVYVGNAALGLSTPGEGVVAGDINLLPVQWSQAIRRAVEEDIPAGFAAEKLLKFQEFYRENPIGIFHLALNKMGVIDSPMPLDETLMATSAQQARLEDLFKDKDFQRMQSLCVSRL